MYAEVGRGTKACLQLMKEAVEHGEFCERGGCTWRMHGGRRVEVMGGPREALDIFLQSPFFPFCQAVQFPEI